VQIWQALIIGGVGLDFACKYFQNGKMSPYTTQCTLLTMRPNGCFRHVQTIKLDWVGITERLWL